MFKKFAMLTVFFLLVLSLFPIPYSLSPAVYAVDEEAPLVIRYARPLSMGGAFLCVTDDQNSFFYNPAGIMQRKDFLMTLIEIPVQITDDMTKFADFFSTNKDELKKFTEGTLEDDEQTKLLNDIFNTVTKYRIHLTAGLPNANLIFKSNGRWNLGGGIFTIIDMRAKMNKGILVPTIDLWGSLDGALFLTYARRWINIRDQALSVGVNVKYIVRSKYDWKRKSLLAMQEIVDNLEPQVGTGLGFDLGLLAELSKKWRVGLMVRDLLDTKIQYKSVSLAGETKPSGSSKIPRQINLGVAYKPTKIITLAVDVEDITKKNTFTDEFFTHLHLGAEAGWKILRVRGGFNQGYPTFGFGIYTPILLDIEYTYYSNELGRFAGQIPEANHMLALALRF